MKLYKQTLLNDSKLTSKLLATLNEGDSMIVQCESIKDNDNAKQLAYYAKRKSRRPDGCAYQITTSNSDGIITITVVDPN